MGSTKFRYKEVRERQKQDLKSGKSDYYIHRHFSSPFTWLCNQIGLSPNMVTLLSMLICVIGFYFLSRGNMTCFLVGLLLFILFRVLDMVDGELARLTNSGSVEGVFFDKISHYVCNLSLGLGLGIGLSKMYNDEILIYVGFFLALFLALEYASSSVLKSIILLDRKGLLAKKGKKFTIKDIQKLNDTATKKIFKKMNKNRSWDNSSKLTKLFGVYPVQGIFYSETFIPLLFLILIGVQYFLKSQLEGIELVLLYFFAITLSKASWFLIFTCKFEKNRYASHFFKNK